MASERILWDGGRPAPEGWSTPGPATAGALVAEGLPVVTGTADAAYLGPALSGVPLWQAAGVLEETLRLLRPGGRLRVGVLDLDAAVQAYLAGDREFFWSDDWHHPSGALAEQLLESGAARSLFTAPLVAELLGRAGFAGVTVERFGQTGSGDEVLTRPDRLERHCCFAEATRPPEAALPPVDAEPAQVHLSWADARCGSVAVTWCGPAAADAWVEFRQVGGGAARWSAPGRPEATIDGERAPFVFTAASGPLEAGERYEYDVVHEVAGRRHVASGGSFAALPGGEHEVSFAFVADTGIAGRADGLCDGADRMVDELRRTDAAFVLAGGDFAYRSSDPRLRSPGDGVRAWLDQMGPVARHRPLLVQYGNHEVELGERLRDWAPYFPPPAGNVGGVSYSFDAGPCHVAALFAPTEELSAAAVAWLEADLAAARSAGSRWLVVFQHQPLFAHGRSHPADGRVRSALAPTLERQGVDLHLSAHDQSFERTYPLRDARGSPGAGSSSHDRYRRGDGVVYAKVSPGGKRSDRGGDFSKLATLPAHVAAAGDTRHHFAHVRVTPRELVMETFGFGAPDAPLELVDRFTISG